jgi:hypothetical protein
MSGRANAVQFEGFNTDAFLVGQAFKVYRLSPALRSSPMPAFYSSAQALVGQLKLLSRDAAQYRSHFPTLTPVLP